MSIKRIQLISRSWLLLAGTLLAALASAPASAQVALQDIDFVALPGGRFEIQLAFDSTPPTPDVFVIEDPARLTMDFSNVVSELQERRFPLEFPNADSVMILEAQGRTRMVVNLTAPAAYTTRVQGNALIVAVGNEAAAAPAVTVAAQAAAADAPPAQRFVPPQSTGNDIRGLDFRRGEGSSGQIIIDLARTGLDANVNQNGTNLQLEFRNANIEDELQMRLDVTDFATPVQSVSMYREDGNVVVLADISGQYEYLAYQSNNQYIIDVMPVAAAAAPGAGGGTANGIPFSGERISLNFQDIDVRAVLQILADFNDFSLVVGDNVSGNVTLRLVNVPWDQALDLVLRPRGLAQRMQGNVLYIAPAAEIAAAELQALESTQQVEQLAPLVTEYIAINYAEASTLVNLLRGSGGGPATPAADGAPASSSGGVLSDRGSVTVDERTNTLIVRDVESVLDDVRGLIARLDVPVRQVLIEARIVNASTSFSQALGVRWGAVQTFPEAGDQFILGGGAETVTEVSTNLNEFLRGDSDFVEVPTLGDNLNVDLGLPTTSPSIALGYAGDNGLLQLELSALEASGNGEVIAQPKVTTQDQQTARIESGVQIPYQSQAGGTAGGTTTQFVTAALSLEVTPQITPDGRIIMVLDIHQDSVVPGSGSIPAIATNSVNTRVLVNDGDTVVLGGVFREEVTTTVSKTPLLGDIPYVGTLFKRTEESESKTELLIFITPSIINEIL